MFQKFRWTVKFRGKTRPFNVLEWIKVLFSIPIICNFKNKRFFSAGNSTHVNYGQRGNWNFMEGLYVAVCNNCYVFNTSVAKPSPSIVFWVGFVLYKLIRCFKPWTITLNFCLHPTYNIKSKDLVIKPALVTRYSKWPMWKVANKPRS